MLKDATPAQEDHLEGAARRPPGPGDSKGDGGEQTVNHAGAALLAETADRLGLTRALSAGLAGLRQRRSAHDPGRVARDLAFILGDGGDALCDLRGLRDQGALFGPVASDPPRGG